MKKNIKSALSFLGGIAATTLPVISLAGSCSASSNAQKQKNNNSMNSPLSAFLKNLDYTNQTLHDFNTSTIDTTLDQFLIDNGQIVPESFKGKLKNPEEVRVLKEAESTEVEFKLKEPIKVKFKYFTEDKYSEPVKMLLKKIEGMTKVGQYKKNFTDLEVTEELVSIDNPLEFRNYDNDGRLMVLQAQPELRKDFALYVSKLKSSEDMTFYLKRFYSKDKVVQFKKIVKPTLEVKPIINNNIDVKIVLPTSIKTFMKRWLYASKLSKKDVSVKTTSENSVFVQSNTSDYYPNVSEFNDICVFLDSSDKVETQMKKINLFQTFKEFIIDNFSIPNYKEWNQKTLKIKKTQPLASFLNYALVYTSSQNNTLEIQSDTNYALSIPILSWKMETSDLDAMDWKNAIKINPELNAEENLKWKDTPIYLRTTAGSDVNYYMVLEFNKKRIKVINNAANEVRYIVPNKELNEKKEIVISKEVVDNFADTYNGDYQKLDSASFIFD